MYCSNKRFLQIAEDVGVSATTLYSLLEVVFYLTKKYGNLLKSPSFQSVITGADSQVGGIILLLQKIGKLHKKDLYSMLEILGKKSGTTSFSISSSLRKKSLENIKASLEKSFSGACIVEEETNDISLQVKGDGRYYKRGLQLDLDKILK